MEIDSDFAVEVAPETSTEGELIYLARHPDLPGCMAHGTSVEEAVGNLGEARRLYLSELQRRGVALPQLAPPSVASAIWRVLPRTTPSSTANPVHGSAGVVPSSSAALSGPAVTHSR